MELGDHGLEHQAPACTACRVKVERYALRPLKRRPRRADTSLGSRQRTQMSERNGNASKSTLIPLYPFLRGQVRQAARRRRTGDVDVARSAAQGAASDKSRSGRGRKAAHARQRMRHGARGMAVHGLTSCRCYGRHVGKMLRGCNCHSRCRARAWKARDRGVTSKDQWVIEREIAYIRDRVGKNPLITSRAL
ncbi:hypothetical protein SAMN05216280_10142 [Ectopseudomonas oleovorans]|nr:hypothetical protein SAMN05216280_10142 [Pseudomonas oleovorans]